jgi:F-type H+-transporting ATPase subunit epsilon
VTMHVELVTPEGEIWVGDAQRVIAKTLDGDIGILTGHTPVLGILAEGSVVRILPGESGAGSTELRAAVGGGFLAMADDRVSILARQAQLGSEVDRAGAQAALDAAEEAAGPGGDDTTDVRYFRALLRAASDQA